jgi:hypothetical protein
MLTKQPFLWLIKKYGNLFLGRNVTRVLEICDFILSVTVPLQLLVTVILIVMHTNITSYYKT